MSKQFAAMQFVIVAASASLLLACDAENDLQSKAETWRAEAAEQKVRFEETAQQEEASSGTGTNRPQLTGPQRNALRSAEAYLSMMGFSRKGLIEQLSSDAGDDFSVDQATYGAQQAGAC